MPINPLTSDLISLKWCGALQSSSTIGFEHLLPPLGAPAVNTSNTVSTDTTPSGILVTGSSLDGFFPQPLSEMSGNGLIRSVGAGFITSNSVPPAIGRVVTIWDVVYHYGRIGSVVTNPSSPPSWGSRLSGAPNGSVRVLGYYSATARGATSFVYQRSSTGATNRNASFLASVPNGVTQTSGVQFLAVPVNDFVNTSSSISIENDISGITDVVCTSPEGTFSFLLIARVLGVFPVGSYRRMPAGIVITPQTCLGITVTAHQVSGSVTANVDLEIET